MKNFSKYKLIASIFCLNLPIYASTTQIPESDIIIQYPTSIINLAEIFMYVIKGNHPTLVYAEALHEFVKDYRNFLSIQIIITTYIINLNDAHTHYLEKFAKNYNSSESLDPHLNRVADFKRILSRLDSFAKSMSEENARIVIRADLIGSLKDILDEANTFILSRSTDSKTHLFQQDSIYRQEEALFKVE